MNDDCVFCNRGNNKHDLSNNKISGVPQVPKDTSCAVRFTPKCLILQTRVSVKQQPPQVFSPDSILEQVHLVGNSCCAMKPVIVFHFLFSV